MGRSARTRLLTAGILITVFGTGVLVGLVMESELGAAPTPPMPEATEAAETSETSETAEAPEAPEEPAEEEEASERRYIYEEVGPNETQLALIDSIVGKHRERRDSLDEDFETRHEQEARLILLDVRAAIKSVLGPEQAVEYQRLLDEYDAEQARQEQEQAQGETASDSGDERD